MGKIYEETITDDGDKFVMEVIRETIDIVERDFGDSKGYTEEQREDIKKSYIEEGLPVMRDIDEKVFIRKEEVTVDEKIKLPDSRIFHTNDIFSK